MSHKIKRQPLPWSIPIEPLLISAAVWAVGVALWWLIA
jgi:hypothetical protein